MAEISKIRFGGVNYDIKSITDTSLLESGVPADAKITGKRINKASGITYIESWINGYYPLSSATTNIGVSGYTESVTWICAYVECVEGDVFYVTSHGNTTGRPYAFIDADNKIIARASNNELDIDDYRIVAPAGAVYALFNNLKQYKTAEVVIGEYVKNDVISLESRVGLNTEKAETAKAGVEAIASVIGTSTEVNSTGNLLKTDIVETESLGIYNATSATISGAQLFEPVFPGGNIAFVGNVINNNDGSYTINGTATAAGAIFLNQKTRTGKDNLLSMHGNFTISIEVISGTCNGNIAAMIYDAVAQRGIVNSSLTIPSAHGQVDSDSVVIAIYTVVDSIYDNFTFRLMVNPGEVAIPWEAFKKPEYITSFDNTDEIAKKFVPSIWVTALPSTATMNLRCKQLKDFASRDSIDGTDYMRSAVIRMTDELKSKSEFGNIVTFGFSTDQHIKDEDDEIRTLPVIRGLKVLSKLTHEYPYDFICLGGDACEAGAYALTPKLILDECITIQKPLYDAWCPVIPITGNHDASQNNNTITGEMLFNAHFKRIANSNFINGWDNAHTNGYWDSNAHKIRFIFWDDTVRADYTAIQRTDALSAMLSGTPEGYSIVIFSHHVMSSALANTHWADPTPAQSIINPYADRIICCICGHVHADVSETKDGILYISTTTAGFFNDADGNSRTIDSENETAFDTFVIDQNNKTIYAIRYGYGNNRTFSYDSSSSSFGEIIS